MRNRNGFTLIELLVVIGVVAILASVILPSHWNSREVAKLTRCKTNLQQVYMGLSLYAADHQYYPAAWPKYYNEDYNQNMWSFKVAPYLGNCKVATSWQSASDIRNGGALNCPALEIQSLDYYCYSMNTFSRYVDSFDMAPAASPGVDLDNPGNMSLYVKPASRCTTRAVGAAYIPNPSQMLFVAEMGFEAGNNKAIYPNIWDGNQLNSIFDGLYMDGVTASFRHMDRKSVLWFDGHVSMVRPAEVSWYLIP